MTAQLVAAEQMTTLVVLVELDDTSFILQQGEKDPETDRARIA